MALRVDLRHDQRDVVLVAELRGVVDDDAAGGAGAWARTRADTSAPAENRPICARLKSKVATSIDRDSPCPGTPRVLPSERLLASGNSSRTGKSRSSSTRIMVSPTRPVAPSTATLQPLLMTIDSFRPLRGRPRRIGNQPVITSPAWPPGPQWPGPRTARRRSARDGAGSGPSARSPAWPRRWAWRAARRRDRAGRW